MSTDRTSDSNLPASDQADDLVIALIVRDRIRTSTVHDYTLTESMKLLNVELIPKRKG